MKVRINTSDIIGKQSGKLTVEAYVGCHYIFTEGGQRLRHFYQCRCECGTIKTVQRGPLLNEITRSCGCSKRRR